MHIILSLWFDRGSYPDALHQNEATIGKVVIGFQGLIGILETNLGLTTPKASENIRIAEWQQVLSRLDTGSLPYSKSFKTDSWNTARELLRRRDGLIISGWDPNVHINGGKWIETLAKVERANVDKTPGFSDRVRTVMKVLQEETISLPIEKISIVDEDIELWEPWAIKLIDLLKDTGVEVEHYDNYMLEEKPQSDLSLLRAILFEKHPPKEAIGDRSILFIHAEQEIVAADFLASFLQQRNNERTVIIKGDGSLLLDEVLHRQGVAALGVDEHSKWRAVLQVLPLTIDTYWEPLRVERMLELLTIPTSPVPGKIRHRLAQAMSEFPGIGGEKWKEALQAGIESYKEEWRNEGIDEKEYTNRLKKLEKRINLWIDHDYYDPLEGMPVKKLIEICHHVAEWARSLYHTNDDVMYMEAAKVADELIEGVMSLGVEKVSSLQIARILDSIIGAGTTLTSYKEEAANWAVVQHPGQIWDEADTIIWWGFHHHDVGATTRTWTKKERSWLIEQGIELPKEEIYRKREALAWHRAIKFAKKRLIFIAPTKAKGEEVAVHPLWDEVRYAIANEYTTVNKLMFDATVLRKEENVNLFSNHTLVRTEKTIQSLPEPKVHWYVPENTIQLREKESATSLESLIGCPLQWTFKYVASIRPGNIISLPHESIMLGNLGHAILESLIVEKPTWEQSELTVRIDQLFDDLTPKLAAPLLEPQNRIKANQTKMNLQKSLQRFFRVLQELNITIEATEIEMAKKWDDHVQFQSRLDLVLKTSTGNKMLIDAKWSNNANRYRERLEKLSVQLALYHWLLVDDEDKEFPVAYFMLRSGEFFSNEHEDLPPEFHVDGPSLKEAYETIRTAVADVLEKMQEGTVVASGVLKKLEMTDETFTAVIDPPCDFCEYKRLCQERSVVK